MSLSPLKVETWEQNNTFLYVFVHKIELKIDPFVPEMKFNWNLSNWNPHPEDKFNL